MDLTKKGYAVFTELGDLSRTDLIALVGSRPVKIQVKARNLDKRAGTVPVETRKCGPKYAYSYTEDDVDVFAIYILSTEQIFYVGSKELIEHKSIMSFRVTPTKNNQTENTHYVVDYLDFERAIPKPRADHFI